MTKDLKNKGKNVLYTGSTKNLINRVKEHRKGYQKGFTQKYNVNRLVYCEAFEHIDMAKDREKQIKGWKRQRKIELRGRKHPDPSNNCNYKVSNRESIYFGQQWVEI